MKRTWAEISKNALVDNYNNLKKLVGENVCVMAVVKADAYGHDISLVCPVLEKCGANWFAVASLDEAIELRKLGISADILIFGYTSIDYVSDLAEYNLTQTVFSTEYALELNNMAAQLNVTLNIHIKIDTGMSRLGLICHSSADIEKTATDVAFIHSMRNLNSDGIYMHFAVADEDTTQSEEFTALQFSLFSAILDIFSKRGISFKWRHACNSAGTLYHHCMWLNMVRVGLALYGLYPREDMPSQLTLTPVMSVKSIVSMVKYVSAGDTVSYGRTFTVPIEAEQFKVATVPIGYADGYPRALSNSAQMLINGVKVKVIGRVCMDQLMLDVTNVDAKVGDIVTVFGNDNGECIGVGDLAEKIGTISYEIVCGISHRVTRVNADK